MASAWSKSETVKLIEVWGEYVWYIDSYNIIFDSTYFGKLQLVHCVGVLKFLAKKHLLAKIPVLN